MRLLPFALAALPLSALADTYTVASTPTAVTVYSGFAVVTREVSVEVGAGAHELVLPNLPQGLSGDSLRVTLRGATLAGTRLRTDALPPQPDQDSTAIAAANAQIEAAERALRDLDDAVQDAGLATKAAEARLAFLMGLASSDTLPSTPDALASLGGMIEAQTLSATQTQIAAQRAAREIEEGRSDLEEVLADARAALAALTPPAEPAALLALSIAAQQAGAVIASVSYPVQASWQPTYDVILNRTDVDTMTVRRAALISQSSGENWEDVVLTLSTLAPSGQVVPSEVFPPLVRFEDQKQRGQLQRSSASLADSLASAPMIAMEAAPVPQPDFDGPGVTYTLPATLTIAQNAEAARVELGTLELEARVFARAIPARDSTAFLMAQGTNESLEPLLAAQRAQIFIDGALVGQSYFTAVPAGGTLTQAFGSIEDIRLSQTIIDKSEGDRGLISRSNAQTQNVQMTVENLGSKTWDVELLAGLPYSEQDDLVVEWSAQPRASETDVDGRRGLAQWNLSLAPQATQEIAIEQVIRWPDGMVLR